MTLAKAVFVAAALLATISAASAQPGEFPWQLGNGIHLPPPPPQN